MHMPSVPTLAREGGPSERHLGKGGEVAYQFSKWSIDLGFFWCLMNFAMLPFVLQWVGLVPILLSKIKS